MANFMPEYSVWKPATISESASIRSKGLRLISAQPAMKKSRKPSGCKQDEGDILCQDDLVQGQRAGHQHHADEGEHQRYLVADHGGDVAHGAEQGVLVAGAPPGHENAHRTTVS